MKGLIKFHSLKVRDKIFKEYPQVVNFFTGGPLSTCTTLIEVGEEFDLEVTDDGRMLVHPDRFGLAWNVVTKLMEDIANNKTVDQSFKEVLEQWEELENDTNEG